MNYITDYQLDIKRGFQCKVNEKFFNIWFSLSSDEKSWFLSDQFKKLLIELELDPNSVIKSYGTLAENHLVYCDSKQQCYDLCQHIVDTYFKPIDITNKETKEYNEKSRRYLAKYYLGNEIVKFNTYSFKLKSAPKGGWFWHCLDVMGNSQDLWNQFSLTHRQVLTICNILNISGYLHGKILIFETPMNAIKFTDYLIETYIIKKEKTYDTNQLRKERTSFSRGAKPAGSIIHGRRSKASVRCRHLEHKARIGC